MNIDIAQLWADRAEAEVKCPLGTFTLVYNPQKLTGEFFAAELPLLDAIAAVLVEWPLTSGGEPIPTTREGLLKLPDDALLAIWRAILESRRGNREAPTDSSETSES